MLLSCGCVRPRRDVYQWFTHPRTLSLEGRAWLSGMVGIDLSQSISFSCAVRRLVTTYLLNIPYQKCVFRLIDVRGGQILRAAVGCCYPGSNLILQELLCRFKRASGSSKVGQAADKIARELQWTKRGHFPWENSPRSFDLLSDLTLSG